MIEIIRVTETHVPRLARVMARAFLHEPLYEFILPDAATRGDLIALDMGNIIRYGVLFGEVHTTSDLTGCAVWLLPGETDFTEERGAQANMQEFAKQIGAEAVKRLDLYTTASEAAHKRIMPGAHWYLVTIGVDPGFQGQGIGSALISAVLARADESQHPVFLETSTPGNVRFYEKRGFTVCCEESLPSDGPTVWYMVREPK